MVVVEIEYVSLLKMIAEQLISEQYHVLRTTDSVEGSIDYMCSLGVSELPILEKKQVYNYARLAQLHAVEDKSQSLIDVVAMNPHAPVALANQHLYEIVPVLAANELGVLAVVNNEGQFIGLIDQKRINRNITESMTYRGIGAVVVLNVDDRDFSPAIICRWVEENGAKVLGMMVSQSEFGKLKLNLKLNTTLVKGIISTFRRQGYEVENVYLAEDHSDDGFREFDLALKFFDL